MQCSWLFLPEDDTVKSKLKRTTLGRNTVNTTRNIAGKQIAVSCQISPEVI